LREKAVAVFIINLSIVKRILIAALAIMERINVFLLIVKVAKMESRKVIKGILQWRDL
jgi:hypothetical protein